MCPAGNGSGHAASGKHLLGNKARQKDGRDTQAPWSRECLCSPALQDCVLSIGLGAAMFYQTRCPIV